MIKYKKLNNLILTNIITFIIITTTAYSNLLCAASKLFSSYSSLHPNSAFDEDPRNNHIKSVMGNEYLRREGASEVPLNVALRELDMFLLGGDVPQPEFIGFDWTDTRPSGEFIQSHLNMILGLTQSGRLVVHRLPGGRLRFSRLREHYSIRDEGLTPPDIPCPISGGEVQIIQGLLQADPNLIAFLLDSESGIQWLLYSIQKLFIVDPPYKFNQLFFLVLQIGPNHVLTKLFYYAIEKIDPAKAGLIILHLVEVCEAQKVKQTFGQAIEIHIVRFKKILSSIAQQWQVDPEDISYLTVFFHAKLQDCGFLEQLNIYPGKDKNSCYFANEDMGPIIEISGDTPENVFQAAIGILPVTHLRFYFPDDLIPYIEYLLDKKEFFFPFREQVSAEVKRRKVVEKETLPEMDISALGSLYGFVISRGEGKHNLRDFLTECTEEYYAKGQEKALLLPEGIVIDHHGIKILLMPDLTKIGRWQTRRTPYRIIGFVEGENLYPLEEMDCKRIEVFLSSSPASEIKHSLILHDYAILADKGVFLKLATSQRDEVYSGHDQALENEIAESIRDIVGPISIVDVGMGGGELLQKMTKRFSKDKRIRFFGNEPDPKSLRLAKVRLPEYIKVSDVPGENLSHADFVSDQKETYKIAIVEGIIALGVNKPSKGKEILEELLRMGFEKVFITGNTPVNLNYEEMKSVLLHYGYKLERTLYPKNLFNHNSPKIMFVISRRKQGPEIDIYPDAHISSMQLLIREDLVDEAGNTLWCEKEWTAGELLRREADSIVTIDSYGNVVFDNAFIDLVGQEFGLGKEEAEKIMDNILEIFRLRKGKYFRKDFVFSDQAVKLYFVDQSKTVCGDCIGDGIVFINLKVVKKLVQRLPGAKGLLSVYLGIFLSHEILGHEVGIHDESLLSQQDAELLNSQIENLFPRIYDTLIRIFKLESLLIKKLEGLIEEFAFVRRIGIKKGDKVVSVGGKGDKGTALAIAYLGGHYIGYEISEMARDIFSEGNLSRYSYKDYGGSIEYIHGLFSYGSNVSANLEDHSVDSILMLTGVLSDPVPESDAASVLKEALRIVKNGGNIIAGTFGLWLFEYPKQKAVIERVLNSPEWKGKVNLHAIGKGFYPVLGAEYIEYKVEFLDNSNQARDLNKGIPHVNEQGKIVENFLSTIRAKAQRCKELDEELVLAIDTDIGNLALFAQELFTALGQLQDTLTKEGLDNVRIIIGNGTEVEAQLKKYLAQKGEKKDFIISAVVKNERIAEDNQFKDIKDRIQITAVDDTNIENTDTGKVNYIPILSILELSIKKAMGTSTSTIRDEYSNSPNIDEILEQNGMLIIYLLPKSKPIPINDLKERYKNEAQLLTSA